MVSGRWIITNCWDASKCSGESNKKLVFNESLIWQFLNSWIETQIETHKLRLTNWDSQIETFNVSIWPRKEWSWRRRTQKLETNECYSLNRTDDVYGLWILTFNLDRRLSNRYYRCSRSARTRSHCELHNVNLPYAPYTLVTLNYWLGPTDWDQLTGSYWALGISFTLPTKHELYPYG